MCIEMKHIICMSGLEVSASHLYQNARAYLVLRLAGLFEKNVSIFINSRTVSSFSGCTWFMFCRWPSRNLKTGFSQNFVKSCAPWWAVPLVAVYPMVIRFMSHQWANGSCQQVTWATSCRGISVWHQRTMAGKRSGEKN